MSGRAVLDSPAAVIPSAPHRLKRSSSEASIASLPTPPRTISKRKRSNSKAPSAADSCDDSDGSVSSKTIANKKRKILDDVQKDDAEEQAFWSGDPTTSDQPSKPVVKHRSPSRTRSMSPEAETSYRARKTGLISPPPSRRQPARKVKKLVTPQPSTPKRRKGKGKAVVELPIRDSPNNPFLDDVDVASTIKTPPRRTGSGEERPTLTYVFRGQKQEMVNPLYKYKPSSNSLLPPEHPDYSPSPACPPRLLFPEAHSRRLQQPRGVKRGRSPSPSSDGDSDDVRATQLKPLTKLAFQERENRDGWTPRAETESRKGRSKQQTIG